jgi:cell division protein FtsW
VQKLDKIPEAQNDMIFSIVCEELGLVGAVVLLAMFLFLIYHLIRIAVNSENLFGKVLVMGIAFHISLQVLINVGVVLTIIPNTGASLPFISYGGSFTLCLMVAVTFAQRVGIETKIRETEKIKKK